MESPLQITYRGFTHDAELEHLIRRRVDELERVARHRLISCHVIVELGHEHLPGARMFHVGIHVTFAGAVVATGPDARDDHGHEDVRVAVHDAFYAAHRRVQHADHRRHAAS
jgi:hypothetical protein